MNHKRGKRKNARAGCLMCKPWKANGCKGGHDSEKFSDYVKRSSATEQIKEYKNVNWTSEAEGPKAPDF